MNLEISRIPLAGHPIARDYVDDYAAVGDYYLAGESNRLLSYQRCAEYATRSADETLWSAIGAAFELPESHASTRLGEVVDGKGFFVATGHQAGLFGGPLMALYKALTAARLAEELQERLSIPVMPLFSVASEDHDWAEVNHTSVVDSNNQLVRIEIERHVKGDVDPSDPPVHKIELGDDIETAIARLGECLPDSDHKPRLLQLIKSAYRPGSGVSSAFAHLFTELLADYPFLIVEMSHPYTKRATRDLLWADWTLREESSQRLKERTQRLADAGYVPQVQLQERTTNLFVEGDAGRDRVLWDGDTAVLRRSGQRFSGAELKRLIDESSERVSPGVLLRPLVEARAFPVIAHVVGPAEIAYLAQNQVLYDLHAIAAPVVVPRTSIRLIEPKVRRALDKYGLEPSALSGDTERVISDLVKGSAPAELTAALDALRAATAAALEGVEKVAVEYDPGAKSAVGSGTKAVREGIKTLEKKLMARVKEKNQVMQQQLEKVAVNLYPSGTPQERVLNPHPYLARYGPEMLAGVYEACTVVLD